MIGAVCKLLFCCAVAGRCREGVVARGVDVRVDVLVGVCCVAWYCGGGGGGGVAVGLGWVGLGWVWLRCGSGGALLGRVGSWWVVTCGGAWMVVTPWGWCGDRCRE